MKKLFLFILISISNFIYSQDNIKAMFYNVFRFPSEAPANREYILKEILNEYQPDLFMVCELESPQGANAILNISLAEQQDVYAKANFHYNTSSSFDLLQNLIYYNTRKFNLINHRIHQAPYRDIDQYTFTLRTIEQEIQPIYLEVFVTHLKAGQGEFNQQARLNMVNVFADSLEEIVNPNTFVLFAGDFNLYSASEPAYQKIIGNDLAVNMVDPINSPGNWNENINYSYLHTQSTRTNNSGFGNGDNLGATGGMDDRFDFIMMSENFTTSSQLSYVPNTYRAYGNNQNCFNKSINDPSCTGEYSAELRENLFWMSDHTPVVMEFQTSQTFLSKSEFINKPSIWFNSPTLTNNYIILGIDSLNFNTDYIYIYNIYGQLIDKFLIKDLSEITINVSKFSNGLYIVKPENSSETLKFIKK